VGTCTIELDAAPFEALAFSDDRRVEPPRFAAFEGRWAMTRQSTA
jgi:hypothetical protein